MNWGNAVQNKQVYRDRKKDWGLSGARTREEMYYLRGPVFWGGTKL